MGTLAWVLLVSGSAGAVGALRGARGCRDSLQGLWSTLYPQSKTHLGRLQRRAMAGVRSAAVIGIAGRRLLPNAFDIAVGPYDFDAILATDGWFVSELASATSALAARQGWVLQGPPHISVRRDEARPSGSPLVQARNEMMTQLAGGLPSLPPPQLVRHMVATVAGVPHELSAGDTLGRSRSCALWVDDPHVSRRHCTFIEEYGRWWVEDLDSRNGTTIDGIPVRGRAELRAGTRLYVGRVLAVLIELTSPAPCPTTLAV